MTPYAHVKPYLPMLAVLLLPLIILALLQWGPNQVLSSAILGGLEPWQQHVKKVGDQAQTAIASASVDVAKFRSVELKGRLEYGTASSILRTVAALAIIFALLQLWAGWRAKAPRPQEATVAPLERRVVVVVAVVTT